MEQKKKRQSLISSFINASSGIVHAIYNERNLKIHISVMIITVICGIVVNIEREEWYICFLLFGLVISAELINCAIEAVVDLAMPDRHPLAKVAKDTAAGAVLICAITSVIVGMMLFIPKFIHMLYG